MATEAWIGDAVRRTQGEGNMLFKGLVSLLKEWNNQKVRTG